MQTGLHVALDDENFSDFVVGDGPGFIATVDNYTFSGVRCSPRHSVSAQRHLPTPCMAAFLLLWPPDLAVRAACCSHGSACTSPAPKRTSQRHAWS